MDGSLISLEQYGISVETVIRNATAPKLYEEALKHEPDAAISSNGALIVSSYEKTGRSPNDKRIVEYPSIEKHVWWGKINIGMDADTFIITRARAIIAIKLGSFNISKRYSNENTSYYSHI